MPDSAQIDFVMFCILDTFYKDDNFDSDFMDILSCLYVDGDRNDFSLINMLNSISHSL